MYKAIESMSNKEVIILDPVWTRENIHHLRELDRVDGLLCPGCKEPVRVRAGEERRWHFAHKDLSDCSLINETPAILEARGLLYSWLHSKLGNKVTVEKIFPGVRLPKPIDCYFEEDGKNIGYWILERGVKHRDDLKDLFEKLNVQIVWVFLKKVLRVDNEDREAVHLSPTERDFVFTSQYNELYSSDDEGLFYLDEEEGRAVTLRGLHCVHLPKKYEYAIKLESDLSDMLIRVCTGELIHPGEYAKLQAEEERKREEKRLQAIEEEKRKERLRIEEERQRKYIKELEQKAVKRRFQNQRNMGALSRKTSTFKKVHKEKKKAKLADIFHIDEKPYPCEICGQITDEWVSLSTKDETCICSSNCARIKREREMRRD